jgi:hypothetical protein
MTNYYQKNMKLLVGKKSAKFFFLYISIIYTMSCATSIYRYLNEDKNAIYNESRNIRDNLKYNLDEEYREKIKQKKKSAYEKKKELLKDETIKEFNEYINNNLDYDINILYDIYLNNIEYEYPENIYKTKKNIINKEFIKKLIK